MTSTLRTERLKKSYKLRQVVVDTSLWIGNEILGLLGPNGAGKTTIFYMIMGLIMPDKGNIFLNEKNITLYPMHKRARLGISYLPQESSIFRLSVANNIKAILELRRDLSKKQRQEKSESLMEEFGVSHLRNVPGYSLSGGEKRRVEIARALATDPKFILLDEPFAGVDPISVNDIKQIIIHLKSRGIGILITDHNVRETLKICDRAYIVNNGSIIATGTTTEILNDKNVREVYLGYEFNL